MNWNKLNIWVDRATSSDYVKFSLTLWDYADTLKNKRDYAELFNQLYNIARAFPELLKFFITEDVSIPNTIGIKMNYQDIEFWRAIKRQCPYLIHTCRYILGMRYLGSDVWFFSAKDKYSASRYRNTLYTTHTHLPEHTWFWYPPPDTYNIAEAVHLLEWVLIDWSHIFHNEETFRKYLQSSRIDRSYIWVYLCVCLKLWQLNILPANTVEYTGISRGLYFEDIVEQILDIIDAISSNQSESLVLNGIPMRQQIRKIRVWRQLQNFNIQNIWLDRSNNPDTRKIVKWTEAMIGDIVKDSLVWMSNTRQIIEAIFTQSPPSASSHPQGPLSP